MISNMDELTREIDAEKNGAHFQRIDLHIHSYGSGGSPDVTDATNTPEQIVDTALARGIKVISVTDHAKTDNCAAAIAYAADKDILVIPGVEVTTTQGHLLLYAPSIADVNRVVARLNFSGDMCTNPITQCLNEIKAVHGFGIAAHIDKEKGFELKLQGYGDDKKDLFTHPELLGIELNSSADLDWYTSLDEQEQRRALVEERRRVLHEANDYNIAHVSFSDAHSLARVGKDTEGDDCLTRAKLDEFTFDSLKTAFLDPAARVRAEKQIPRLVPQFIGMKLEGGFLDSQVVSFNSNLTCIIGGRGTGKSTLLESLRAVSGNRSENNLIDSEVWPEKISLIYQDESGARHYLTKRTGEDVGNEEDPDGITQVPIESYGQGDTAQTIKNSDKDPGVLLNFLDRFIDIEAEQQAEREYRDQLSTNQTQIEQLELEVAQLPDVRKRMAYTNSQLNTLNKSRAKELIAYEQALIKERDVRENVEESLSEFQQQISNTLADRQVLIDIDAIEEKGLLAGKAELTSIKKLAKQFATAIDTSSAKITGDTAPLIEQIRQQLAAWKANETKLQQKIDAIRADLVRQGIELDFTFIRKTVNDASIYGQRVRELTLKSTKLNTLKRERATILQARQTNLSARYAKRLAHALKLNEIFAETVDEYRISVKYKPSLFSADLKQLLVDEMGWRTNQVPRAELIASNMSVFDLITNTRTRDTQALEALTFGNGEKAFSRTDTTDILDKLSVPETKFKLERCRVEDRVKIIVSKQIELPDGTKKVLPKDFGKLSLGQQQSVVLTILLFSDTKVPLIIDQPEDDLDSEFIYKTLVKNLRRIKERRQVILVTHNSNIAVLGDAELILPLRASSDKSIIKDRGSIDSGPTKEITCTILEGSKEAFMKRKKLYGV